MQSVNKDKEYQQKLQDYKIKFHDLMDRAEMKVEKLDAGMLNATEELQQQMRTAISELENNKERLRNFLYEFEEASASEVVKMEDAADQLYREVSQQVNDVQNTFNKQLAQM